MLAPTINGLISARILAGIGAGVLTSDSFAIVHDCFPGEQGEKNIALVQSIASIGPVIAPVIGAAILKIASWRIVFMTITVLAISILVLSLRFKESLSLDKRLTGGLLATLGRLLVVAGNKSIFLPLIIFALSSFSFLGYVGVSSYIYVLEFGLSEQQYSIFYAAAALMAIIGPMVYMKFWLKAAKGQLAKSCFVVIFLCGALIMTAGVQSPFVFCALVAVFTFFTAILRPLSMNILFAQQSSDTGSVSALYNCVNFILGSAGMTVTTMGWGNLIASFGAVLCLVAGLELLMWLLMLKSRVPCYSVK